LNLLQSLATKKNDKLLKFLNENEFNFEQFQVSDETDKRLGIGAIPRTIVLNEEGKILYNQIGYDRNEKLNNLRKVLSKL